MQCMESKACIGCFQLTLVRHGETEYNRMRMMQGHKDVALSDAGIQQAKLVAERLAGERFDLAFSSDLIRAKKTADAIVSKLEQKVDIMTDTLLRERNLGDAEGRSLSELIEAAKKSGQSVMEYTPPGAETHQELVGRARIFLANLIRDHCYHRIQSSPPSSPSHDECSILARFCKKHPDNHIPTPSLHVLVASHGGWIKGLLEHILEVCPKGSLPPNALGISPNTGVTSLLVTLGQPDTSSPSSSETPLLRCAAVTSLCVHDASHL